jgi:HK97 family phage major capsid protein
VDEKELKKLEDQLSGLGEAIDKKLKEQAEKYATASKEVKDAIKAEIEPELKKYSDLSDKFSKMQNQLDGLDTKLQRMPFGSPEAKKNFKEATKELLEGLKKEAGGSLRNWYNKNKNFGEIEIKTDDMTQANSFESTAVVQAQHIPGIVFNPDRSERIRDLITPGTTNSNSIEYVYEYAYSDASDITSEGAEYKQGDFDLKLGTATVRKITAYVIVSEEMLDDVEGLSSYISTRLPSKLKVKEDYQLLYGNGQSTNLSGLTHNATAYSDNLADSDITRIDVLVDACRQVRVAAGEYKATAILIHPTDAALIKLAKDDNGNYIHPWIFMPNGQIVLDGVPVIVTTAITAGQFLVGDFKLGAQVFDRKQMTLEMTNQNEDNFVKGMVTVRIAERITIAVYRSTAFVYGTFSAALAQGTA